MGLWTDVDIGNGQDDYAGCDVELGSFYFYNGDDGDENANNSTGYGIYPPAQSISFLAGPMSDPDFSDNGDSCKYSTGNNDFITDNERLALHSFNTYFSYEETNLLLKIITIF